MVKFLIHRPIATTMGLIAVLVLGLVSLSEIPVSLMPDTDIPEITVQVVNDNASARELENSIVSPLRRQLMQVPHLADIHSESRDEQGVIKLTFKYGTDINLAFIEVNEMIDRAMSQFPRDVERPKAIKASASDIPVFYLNLTLKEENPLKNTSLATTTGLSNQAKADLLFPVSQDFVELSRFSSNVIRRRLEQFTEVAMVDMSGRVYSELLVIPNIFMLNSLNISLERLESIIRNSDIDLGNLLIRDGQYQYNVRFNSTLRNKNDIENIYFKVEGRLFQLKDLAKIIEHPQKQKGMVSSNGKNAITMAVIKQSDARMEDLKNSMYKEVERLRKTYPEIEFTITRDQTRLLDYSIDNLGQSLIWGALLAFLVMFLFLRNYKSPLLIGVTIPASLVISLLLFYLLDISVNIISLSGLVLGVGMMIDNSIIVIDNITQHRERGRLLNDACIHGVSEVVRPMISSVLTTCAVFIPLIFIGGIAGALFYDQAMAVAIGLFVSLAVSVTILPVFYRLLYLKEGLRKNKLLTRLNFLDYEGLYEKGYHKIMRNQPVAWVIFIAAIAGAVFLFTLLPATKLPPITKDELILEVDWNDNINITENNRRIRQLINGTDSLLMHETALVGEQQFLLDKNAMASASEAFLYLKALSPEKLNIVQEQIAQNIEKLYPNAVYHFEDADNLFNLIFSDNEPPLIARLRMRDDYGPRSNEVLEQSLATLNNALPELNIKPIAWQEHTVLTADPVKLMVYDIAPDHLFGKLRTAFNEREIMVMADNQDFVPVILGGRPRLMNEVLQSTYINNSEGRSFPVRDLIRESRGHDLKTVVAGQDGQYYPVELDITEDQFPLVTSRIKDALQQENLMEAGFSGSILSNRELIKQLAMILAVSLALLYFILAAQFESLKLPLIVLLEIPIGIFGAFLFLKLFDNSINLMSMIGIVVMSGIIINDSILKIDTINQLRKEGYSLMHALPEAGRRRLKPILMTSITTILALTPLLLTSGIGAELQLPLALAVIGGMLIGTFVSLYFIPLCYYYLKREA